MALNSLLCVDVPLRTYTLTHSLMLIQSLCNSAWINFMCTPFIHLHKITLYTALSKWRHLELQLLTQSLH